MRHIPSRLRSRSAYRRQQSRNIKKLERANPRMVGLFGFVPLDKTTTRKPRRRFTKKDDPRHFWKTPICVGAIGGLPR